MELGIYTFAERTADPLTGKIMDPAKRMSDLIEEVELADQLGLDVFGLGEHHRHEFISSAPAVILAAAAVKTKNIRLTSAVTVLSSDDPVRVFQDFATLDLLSGGRAEIMAGRGSFIESYPLFGYDLNDYDELFSDKLQLLLKLRESEKVTWTGKHRPAMKNLGVYPRPVQKSLPVWIAVGGTPESAIRAGKLGLPLAVAIIGGMPERFAPFVDLYRETAIRSGHKPVIGINSLGYVGDSSRGAAEEYFPYYQHMMNVIGKERGWQPIGRGDFEAMRSPEGALLVGDPEEVAEKILMEEKLFKHQRFMLQISIGTMPHAQIMRAIELYGTRVAEMVSRELGPKNKSLQSAGENHGE